MLSYLIWLVESEFLAGRRLKVVRGKGRGNFFVNECFERGTIKGGLLGA
jgi:hypothetical protein